MEKLVKCKACGKEIAKGVKKCVHCGKDQRNFFQKHKIISGILVLFVIGIIASAINGSDNSATPTSSSNNTSSDTAKQSEPVKKVIKVSAVKLAKAYTDNEVKADKDYKDKTVEVTGKIDDIGVIFGKTFVILSSGVEYSLTSIQCFFSEQTEIDKVSNLKKGQTITIEGAVDGKSMNVGVNDCIIK